jgi:hypothetical protein
VARVKRHSPRCHATAYDNAGARKTGHLLLQLSPLAPEVMVSITEHATTWHVLGTIVDGLLVMCCERTSDPRRRICTYLRRPVAPNLVDVHRACMSKVDVHLLAVHVTLLEAGSTW